MAWRNIKKKERETPCLEWLVMEMRRSINTAAPGTSHKALIVCRQVAGPCIFSTNSPPFPLLFCFMFSYQFEPSLSTRLFLWRRNNTKSGVVWAIWFFCLFLILPFTLFIVFIFKTTRKRSGWRQQVRASETSQSQLHRHTRGWSEKHKKSALFLIIHKFTSI